MGFQVTERNRAKSLVPRILSLKNSSFQLDDSRKKLRWQLCKQESAGFRSFNGRHGSSENRDELRGKPGLCVINGLNAGLRDWLIDCFLTTQILR
jgi:hypothetical protein